MLIVSILPCRISSTCFISHICLKQYSLNLNVHTNHLKILLKCRFSFSRSDGRFSNSNNAAAVHGSHVKYQALVLAELLGQKAYAFLILVVLNNLPSMGIITNGYSVWLFHHSLTNTKNIIKFLYFSNLVSKNMVLIGIYLFIYIWEPFLFPILTTNPLSPPQKSRDRETLHLWRSVTCAGDEGPGTATRTWSWSHGITWLHTRCLTTLAPAL